MANLAKYLQKAKIEMRLQEAGGGVRCGNVRDKNNANRFLFHKANLPVFIHTGGSFTPIPGARSS